MKAAVEKQRAKSRIPPKAESERGIGSPISNEAYNVIAALHAKLEGLEAYRKYAKNESANLWRQLTQNELESVRTLVDELESLVERGELRMREPGDTGH